MINIFVLIIGALIAGMTVKKENAGSIWESGIKGFNIPISILSFFMIMLIGLRTEYNDTTAYIGEFLKADTLQVFVTNVDNFDILKNPLFMLYTSLVRTWTDNYHIYFMVPAIFIVISFISFLMQQCEKEIFPYALFVYFGLGTFCFSLAAMKQTIAMAILTYAIVYLQRKQHWKFLLCVFVAGLFHTYAFLFVMVLFFTSKPWKAKTFILIVVTVAVMFTFESTITSLMQYADEVGKGIAEESVFSGVGMNLFRVAVYGIVPIASLLLKRILDKDMDKKHYILLHMSIISFMFVLIGSINGANVFGRMARYFEIGTIIMCPWIIRHAFTPKSAQIMNFVMIFCFGFFFLYDYQSFFQSYRAITFGQFLISLFN